MKLIALLAVLATVVVVTSACSENEPSDGGSAGGASGGTATQLDGSAATAAVAGSAGKSSANGGGAGDSSGGASGSGGAAGEASGGSAGSGGSAPLKYRTFFDDEYTANASQFDAWAEDGNETYYSFSYILQGTLSMYEATKDVQYLDRVLAWGNTMVDKATVIDADGKKNWATNGKTSPVTYKGTPMCSYLYELQGITELARAVRIVREDAALDTGARATTATKIFNHIHAHVVVKNEVIRGGWSWHQNVIALYGFQSDKSALLAVILLNMHRAGATTIKSGLTYAQASQVLVNGYLSLVSAPTANNPVNIAAQDAEIWAYKKSSNDGKSEDTSHANRWPMMLMQALDSGLAFDTAPTGSTLIENAAKTGRLASRVIWNKSTSDPKFTNYIDGDNSAYQSYEPWRNGLFWQWTLLGIWEPEVLQAGEAVMDKIVAGQAVFPAASVFTRTIMAGDLTLARVRSGS